MLLESKKNPFSVTVVDCYHFARYKMKVINAYLCYRLSQCIQQRMNRCMNSLRLCMFHHSGMDRVRIH